MLLASYTDLASFVTVTAEPLNVQRKRLHVLEAFISFFAPFVTLSYPTVPPTHPDSFYDSVYYTTGSLDVCLVVTLIAAMEVLYKIARIYLMEPFAKWKLIHDWEKLRCKGIVKFNHGSETSIIKSSAPDEIKERARFAMSKREVRRINRNASKFAEQGWSFLYYSASFTFGVFLYHKLPTRIFYLRDMWLNYPHVPLARPVKLYYLVQIAFYIHQVHILRATTRRKDHVQMMVHHILTIALYVGSYAYNLTRIGCIFMMLTDCCDVLLPLGKMLRYLALHSLCDAIFVIFLIAWCITRHVLFLIVMESAWLDSVHIVSGTWAPERGNYLSPFVHMTFSILLLLVQVIQVVWLWMILRVAYRVVTGRGASDVRSDGEDEDTDHD